jgi:serine/threonine protein kinase
MLIKGRYETGEMLGDGLLAETYAARDRETGAEVVVKQVRLKGMPGWKPLELFEREVAVLRAVKHPGVPRFVDAFQTEGEMGLAMVLVVERVAGESMLARIQRRHRWEEGEARAVLERLLEVLDHLHGLSPPVIHRDIKPSNVIIQPDGRPVLIDFGAVHDLAARMGDHSLTVVGTAGYLPPEQAMGAPVPASDIFALGATMVHALTHCHPADLERDGLRLVFADRVGCSRQLIEILARMVEPDVHHRYRSAARALADLHRPAGEPTPEPEPAVAVRRPVELTLPPSPRSVTRGAESQIAKLAFFRGVKVSTGTLFALLPAFTSLAFLGLSTNTLLASVVAGAAVVFAAGGAVRKKAAERYRRIYEKGEAVRGVVTSVNHVTEGATLYADVKYAFTAANGHGYSGAIHYSDRVASRMTRDAAVLVVYHPADPRQHVAMVVST